MGYQKTFAFEAANCPKINSEFWRNVDASIHVCWGEPSIKEIEYESQNIGKRKVIKVVITAKTISHLCNCCRDLGEQIADFKAKHRNFFFYETTLLGSFEQDEEQNKNYRKKKNKI